MFIILYFYCTSIFTIFGVNLMGSSKNVDHPAINTNVRVFKKNQKSISKEDKRAMNRKQTNKNKCIKLNTSNKNPNKNPRPIGVLRKVMAVPAVL